MTWVGLRNEGHRCVKRDGQKVSYSFFNLIVKLVFRNESPLGKIFCFLSVCHCMVGLLHSKVHLSFVLCRSHMPGCRNSRGKRQEKSRERVAAYRILRGGLRRIVVEASHPNDNQGNQLASSLPPAVNHNPLDADLVKKGGSGVCNDQGTQTDPHLSLEAPPDFVSEVRVVRYRTEDSLVQEEITETRVVRYRTDLPDPPPPTEEASGDAANPDEEESQHPLLDSVDLGCELELHDREFPSSEF